MFIALFVLVCFYVKTSNLCYCTLLKTGFRIVFIDKDITRGTLSHESNFLCVHREIDIKWDICHKLDAIDQCNDQSKSFKMQKINKYVIITYSTYDPLSTIVNRSVTT